MASKPPVPAFKAPAPRPKANSTLNDGATSVNASAAEHKTGDLEPANNRSSGAGSHASAGISATSGKTNSSASSGEVPEALLRYKPPDWAADVAPAEAAARTQATAAAAFKVAAATAGLDGADNDGDEEGENDSPAQISQYMEAAAATPWRLEVMKGGMPMGDIELGEKTHLSLGRQGGGACDVVLEHPSISRAHAVTWTTMYHRLHGVAASTRADCCYPLQFA